MFGWVVNTPLPLDGYYLHGVSILYADIVVRECFKDVILRLQCS